MKWYSCKHWNDCANGNETVTVAYEKWLKKLFSASWLEEKLILLSLYILENLDCTVFSVCKDFVNCLFEWL